METSNKSSTYNHFGKRCSCIFSYWLNLERNCTGRRHTIFRKFGAIIQIFDEVFFFYWRDTFKSWIHSTVPGTSFSYHMTSTLLWIEICYFLQISADCSFVSIHVTWNIEISTIATRYRVTAAMHQFGKGCTSAKCMDTSAEISWTHHPQVNLWFHTLTKIGSNFPANSEKRNCFSFTIKGLYTRQFDFSFFDAVLEQKVDSWEKLTTHRKMQRDIAYKLYDTP